MMKMFPRLLSVLILNDLYKHTQCLLSIEYGQLIQTVSILFNIQRIAPLHAHCCNTYVFFTNKVTLPCSSLATSASAMNASGLAFWAEVNVCGNFTNVLKNLPQWVQQIHRLSSFKYDFIH